MRSVNARCQSIGQFPRPAFLEISGVFRRIGFEQHGKCAGPAGDEIRTVDLGGVTSQAQSRESVEQRGQGDAAFQPGQMSAEADMWSPAERQLVSVISVDVEGIGVRIVLRVPPDAAIHPTMAPAGISTPAMVTSCSAYRVGIITATEDWKRSISSTTFFHRSSAWASASCSGWAHSVTTALPSRCTVVSCPAISTNHNMLTSSSSVKPFSTLASSRAEVRSSPGACRCGRGVRRGTRACLSSRPESRRRCSDAT